MICISFQMHSIYKYLFSQSTTVSGRLFTKLSFKVAYAYVCVFTKCDICLQCSDVLNKNTLGVKKCKVNQKQHCKQVGVSKNFDIS